MQFAQSIPVFGPNITPDDVQVGDVIEVRGNFGRNLPVRAEITEVDPEGKNGHPVVCYTTLESGHNRWAYFYQIDRIVERKGEA